MAITRLSRAEQLIDEVDRFNVAGTLPDYPAGHDRLVMRKRLEP